MINLNGVDLPSFVKLEGIEFSVLPPIQNNTLQVRGKKGTHLYGQQFGSRILKANIIIQAEPFQVIQRTRELAEWLYHEKPVKLILADDNEKYYLVVPDGDSDIQEIISIGMGTISFLCTEPFAFSIEPKTQTFKPVNTDPFYVHVAGNAETYPIIDLKVNEDITSIAVVTDDDMVLIGEPNTVATTPTNGEPTRLYDPMENALSWQSANHVDGGSIQGTLTTRTDYSVSQTEKNYGTGSGWHGGSLLRSLPAPITDFEAAMLFQFKAQGPNRVGRIEMYLVDQNGEHLAKMSFLDGSTAGDFPHLEARAGDLNEGHYFVKNFFGSVKGYYRFFYGRMHIRRQGNFWQLYIGRWDDARNDYVPEKVLTWRDYKNLYTNKLAAVQIHIGAYGNIPPVDLMEITDVRVKEFVELTPTQTPLIAEKGDTLRIDCSKSIVYKAEPGGAFKTFNRSINPASKFIKFKKGTNYLSVTVPNTDVSINYQERWL